MDYISHGGPGSGRYPKGSGKKYLKINRKTGDFTLKKGATFKRLSVYDESKAKGHAYVNYLREDVQRYRGFFGANLRRQHRGKDVQSITLTAKKDLKAPSKQTRIDTFKKLHATDKNISKELADYHKKDWHYFTPLPRKVYEIKIRNLKGDKLIDYGYKHFVRAIGGNPYIRDAYFKELSKKGYSMVTDDLDAGKFGKAPAIIFDRNKSTKYGGQSIVSKEEIMKTWKKYGTHIKKK